MRRKAEEWLTRFEKAGGRMRINTARIWVNESNPPPEAQQVWAELGPRRTPLYQAVFDLVGEMVPPPYEGWSEYPPKP